MPQEIDDYENYLAYIEQIALQIGPAPSLSPTTLLPDATYWQTDTDLIRFSDTNNPLYFDVIDERQTLADYFAHCIGNSEIPCAGWPSDLALEF